MTPSMIAKSILLCLSILIKGTSGRYPCLCSYLVDRAIFEKPNINSNVDGYMYEFDCKPVYKITGLDKLYVAVGHGGKIGYVHTSPNTLMEICQGSIPDKDKVNITSIIASTPISTAATSSSHEPARTTLTVTAPSSASLTSVTSTSRLFAKNLIVVRTTATTKRKTVVTATPTECPEQVRLRTEQQYLHQHRNKCYEFVPRNESWLQAKHYCNRSGGNLLSIEHEEEQMFIRSVLARLHWTSPVWFGLHDRVNEEQWEWDNGASLTYTNWMPGRYIDQYHEQEDCGLFVPSRKGQWDDVLCNGIVFGELMRYNWICQYSVVSTHATEMTTTDRSHRLTPYPITSHQQSTQTTTYTSTKNPDIIHSTLLPSAHTDIAISSPVTFSTTAASQATAEVTAVTTNSTQKETALATRLCAVCSGPAFLCEKLYQSTTCTEPNNYCINKITNNKDGTRMVNRACGNFDTCRRDWYQGSSDKDKCRGFDENNEVHLSFDCTFCCIQDNCNIPLRPKDSTLYKEL